MMPFQQFNEESNQDLAKEIRDFLTKHGKVRPDYDPKWDQPEEKWTSPDAGMMNAAADLIEKGDKVDRVWSDWGSGGYKPYNDQKARDWHDSLMKRIGKFMR